MNLSKTISVLCFGTGSMASYILAAVIPEKLEISAFIDERAHMRDSRCMGAPVIGPESIAAYAYDYVLVACRSTGHVAGKLRDLGVPAHKIVLCDFENLLAGLPLDADCSASIANYLRQYPGLEQSINIDTLVQSSWLAKALPPAARSSGGHDSFLGDLNPDKFSAYTDAQAVLEALREPPPTPKVPASLSMIHIESTNLCSYRCFCCSVWNTKRPKGFVSEESLKLLADRVGPFSGEVALNYCGEPLLDKQLPQKIGLLRSLWPQAVISFVSTLGVTRDPAYFEALWDNGLNKLDVSHYGHTPEDYKKIHGVDRHASAKKNLRHMLKSAARKRVNGKLYIRRLHVEEQAGLLSRDYLKHAAQFQAEVTGYPGVAMLDTYLMTQAGNSSIAKERSTNLPGSIAWGAFAESLYVTWELDVTLCCAVTGDEFVLGNLTTQSLQEIFSGEKYRRFIRASWEDNLTEYPFCRNCERHIGGSREQIVRIALWKIVQILDSYRQDKPAFTLVGEASLTTPLARFFKSCLPRFFPFEDLPQVVGKSASVFVFIVAREREQVILHQKICRTTDTINGSDIRVLPVLGAGFPQDADTIARLHAIYKELKVHEVQR